MRIVTWSAATDDYTHSRRPRTARLTVNQIRQRPDDAIEDVPGDAQAIVMPHPFGRGRNDETGIEWMLRFAAAVNRHCREVRTVWIDHPPNDWRRPDGGDRRHPDAIELFQRMLSVWPQVGVHAAQYGVWSAGSEDDLLTSPVLWTEAGTIKMLSGVHLGTVMPWVRGIGQWAPNSHAPTIRTFLHDLLSCWRVGAEEVLVWFDPSNVTEMQLQQMAECIDVASGLSFTSDDEPADDMDRLLSTLAGGGAFTDILDVLASWGGTGGEIDPDLGGGA